MNKLESFFRDTWAEIDLDRIHYNVSNVKALLPEDVALMAVVKANAYGHGDVQVAKTALEAGANYLAVAFLDEALALRKKGIDAPILVLGATRSEYAHLAAKNNITLTVFQKDWFIKCQDVFTGEQPLKIHLKMDTGMGRIGIREKEELIELERLIRRDHRFVLEGVFTHFATADSLDSTYYEQQLKRFHDFLSYMEEKPKLIHASNSAASLMYKDARFSMVRLGISMYGLSPSVEIKNHLPFPLKQAFSLYTKLTHVKKLSLGEKVSYGMTYEASGEEWIGTLPIGYADGWIRKLQGQEVLVDGVRIPIVGRICMDQCMVKLPKKYPVGTTITLIGDNGNDCISMDEIAAKLQTINYEVPCIITARVPRVYRKSGEVVEVVNSTLRGIFSDI